MGTRNHTNTSESTTLDFQLLKNGIAQDAYSVTNVVIYPTNADAVANTNAIQTIAAGSISHTGTGLYEYIAAIIATAGTYYDKITLVPDSGGLSFSFINSFTVAAYSSGDIGVPTATNIRDFLEGYGITSTVLTDKWIEGRRDNFVIPCVERITYQSFSAIASTVEYHSGVGKNILLLDRRPIVDVQEIKYVLGGENVAILNLAMVQIIKEQGILKSKTNYDEAFLLPVFAKGEYNIQVTYTYGYTSMPSDVGEAVMYLFAEQALGFIGSRTGGGALTVQGFTREYGDRGKYQYIRNDLSRQAHAILANYCTSVTGS